MVTARATIVIDDPHIRVTTWTFAEAGHATGPHVHEYDYIVVPVTGGTFTITDADGITREMTQGAGSPYRGDAGTDHNVISSTDASVVFVEVELKH
jgi:quercetin dioxygenase-like cupin family protein